MNKLIYLTIKNKTMAKFKKGDRVINLQTDDYYIPYLAKGTVNESGSLLPWVIWDKVKPKAKKEFPKDMRFAQWERFLGEEPTATIEIYKSRGQFKFRVKGANSKTLNHLYDSKQGCKKGIEALAKAMSNYKVIDLTKKP